MNPFKRPRITRKDIRRGAIWGLVILLAPVAAICGICAALITGQILTYVGAGQAECVKPDVRVFPTGQQARLVDRGLTTGELCAAPCWQNITPGETSYQDADAILKSLTIIQFDRLDYSQDNATVDGIDWKSALSPTWAEGHIDFQKSVTWKITFDVEYPLTVGQVIDSLGEPEYIGLLPYIYPDAPAPPCDNVTLLWMKRGVEVLLPVIDERKLPASAWLIQPDTPIVRAHYFPPTYDIDDLVRTDTGLFSLNVYQEWYGYDQITRPSH